MLDLLSKLGWNGPKADAATAWRLAGQGQFADAVRTAEKLGQPEGDLAKALVGWRNRAALGLPAAQGAPVWPPAAPDPFPQLVDTIPETTPDKLTPDLVGGALLHHGSLIIRGLLDPATIEALKATIDQAFAVREEHIDRQGPQTDWYAHAPIDDPELIQNRPWQGRNSMVAADTPRGLAHWVSVLRGMGMDRLMTRHFGEPAVMSAKKTTFYRVPPDAGSQWHQDGAFLGADIRTVNLWTALSDCGVDAPGLDVVPWRLPEVVPTNTHGAFFNWSVGEGLVEELAAGRAISTPVFRPGDAILFDQLCLHRTAVRPTMTKTRYAVENWMFAPTYYRDPAPLLI